MDNAARKQIMSDFDKYKRAACGDVAYNMMRMWQGAVGLAPTDGLVSPAYVVARPYPEVESRYYTYLFRTSAYMNEVNKFSRGIVTDRNRLYWEEFKQMPSVVPPLHEQQNIATFLDYHGRLVSRLIRTKQQLIELLNEQKQAIIHRAISPGLDPDAPTKPTGLDWLPQVPKHWEIRRLRSCFSSVVSGLWGDDPLPDRVNEHIVCVRVADFDIEALSISNSRLTVRSVPEHIRRSRLLQTKDLLIEKSGGGDAEPVGRVVLFDLNCEAICSNFVSRIRPDKNVIRSEFLLYVLSFLQASRRNVPSIKQTTGIQNLDERHYFAKQIAVPPLKEQDKIIERIERQLQEIREAQARVRREINLIREYRTRLISDVVTGKLDVRGVELPEVEENGTEDPPGVEETSLPAFDAALGEPYGSP